MAQRFKLNYAPHLGLTRPNEGMFTTLSGPADPGLNRDYQTANTIKNLKCCAELCEQAGLTMLIESINGIDFPGTFARPTKAPWTYRTKFSTASATGHN